MCLLKIYLERGIAKRSENGERKARILGKGEGGGKRRRGWEGGREGGKHVFLKNLSDDGGRWRVLPFLDSQ